MFWFNENFKNCGGVCGECHPNGALVTWEYEPHRDLMTLVSNDVYSTFHYTYDAAGKRVSKNDERYTYNVRGELILATNIVTGAEFAYRYDDIGNRLWSREFGTNCTYVANELNHYTNIVRGGVFELSAFDLDGNQTNVVTSTGEWAVEYNAENQPKVWKSSQINVSLAYDWRGRRILKGIVFSVYDDFLDISEMIWDPTERYATRPLCFQRNGLGGYLLHDGNKNVVAIINSSDSSVSLIEYSPVGAVVSALDFGVHCLFSSEIYDVELGMSSYSTRYYNSYAARWSVRDFAGETAGVNLYALLGNDSVGLTDYLGYSKTGGARAQCERAGGNFINEKCCCEKDVFDPANSCCLDLVLGKQTYSRDGEVAAVRHSWHFFPDDFMFKRYNMEDHVWLTWLGKSVDSNGFGNGVVGSPAQTFSNANSNGRSNGDQEIKLSWCEYDVFAFLSCLTSTAEEDAKSKKHGGLCNVYVDGLIDKCKKTAKRPNPL